MRANCRHRRQTDWGEPWAKLHPAVHQQPNSSVKKQFNITYPIVAPWRTPGISTYSTKITPQSEQKRRERPARKTTGVSRHFSLTAVPSSHHVVISKCRPSLSVMEKGRFLLPRFSLAYGWRWGRNLPTSPHRRLVNVPIVCISSVGRTTHLLLFAFYASLRKLFFSRLKIFLGRNMLPSAIPRCCNCLL